MYAYYATPVARLAGLVNPQVAARSLLPDVPAYTIGVAADPLATVGADWRLEIVCGPLPSEEVARLFADGWRAGARKHARALDLCGQLGGADCRVYALQANGPTAADERNLLVAAATPPFVAAFDALLAADRARLRRPAFLSS